MNLTGCYLKTRLHPGNIQAKQLTMKRLTYILTLFICLAVALPSFAVTEKEMDQARAIAAKAYLRYANDGSGYLDDINAKSMSELEKALKAKEKENIKAFKNIPVPKDYASWDKQKLVDYWGNKAFASKGLLDKGRIGKSRAKKNLNAMKISDPVKEEKKQVAQETSAPEVKPESRTTQVSTETQSATQDASELLSDPLSADLDSDPQLEKAKDHTWIYIIILCILVGVVVALVVFASNVMKKNGDKYKETVSTLPGTLQSSSDGNAMKEKYAAAIASKNEEISTLSKKVESLNTQNNSLKSNLEALTAEIASLRTRIAESNKKIAEYESALQSAHNHVADVQSVTHHEPTPQQQVNRQAARQTQAETVRIQPQAPGVRSIFLGRANSKGIFVRADRSLNPGNSVFRLDTTDGYAGTFRVVSDPVVWEMVMRSPVETLSGACVSPDLTDTDGMTRVVNDSAGTAIFESGCWKMIRKAKIHYE